jgi:hypothetical protein
MTGCSAKYFAITATTLKLRRMSTEQEAIKICRV